MPADVCGPFTLEQLDLFGGNLDTLAFSLDDAVWTSANTCVLYGEGQVSATGNLDTVVIRIRPGEGAISAVG
jgi:hypothetical protein